MEILSSCSSVSTTVWLHHMDSNKMPLKNLDGN